VVIVRFADDFVVGFEHERDARRFLAVVHALQIHPHESRRDCQ
jgi:hypothetical protein